ncbi:hypothetical protein PoB_004562500 [Plakobranchus ocellatus]|uniref:Uncharacterized protein n=1 Tax=Plakobranchus ocellatus TaxID=259542 RepID=A0AAV4BEV1_9GAST|nr:hypothetical protein PoB_004562500 [Plakobranchus ocellatus]
MVPTGVICILLCAALSTVSSAPADHAEEALEKRSAYHYDCMVSGYRFRHGEVFNIPGYSHCLRYRCVRGGWDIYDEACEVDGQCHRVGSTFERNCVTYRCERSVHGDGYWYQPNRIRTLCEDVQGRCRGQGQTFAKYIRGHYYRRCQCLISAEGHIRYSCGNK